MNPTAKMTAEEAAKDCISKWDEIKFIRQDEIITAMNTFAAQAREEGLEEGNKMTTDALRNQFNAGVEAGKIKGFEQARDLAAHYIDIQGWIELHTRKNMVEAIRSIQPPSEGER